MGNASNSFIHTVSTNMETAVKNQKSSPDRQQLPIVQVALTLSARLTRRQKRMRNEQQHGDGGGGLVSQTDALRVVTPLSSM